MDPMGNQKPNFYPFSQRSNMFQAGAEVSLSPTASQRAQKTQPSQGGRAMDDPLGPSSWSHKKWVNIATFWDNNDNIPLLCLYHFGRTGGSRDVSRFCQPNFLIGVQCWYFGQVPHTNSQSFDPHVLSFCSTCSSAPCLFWGQKRGTERGTVLSWQFYCFFPWQGLPHPFTSLVQDVQVKSSNPRSVYYLFGILFSQKLPVLSVFFPSRHQ